MSVVLIKNDDDDVTCSEYVLFLSIEVIRLILAFDLQLFSHFLLKKIAYNLKKSTGEF